MTNKADYTTLKAKAEAAKDRGDPDERPWYTAYDISMGHHPLAVDESFIEAASPDVVLSMIADSERKDALLRDIGEWIDRGQGASSEELMLFIQERKNLRSQIKELAP